MTKLIVDSCVLIDSFQKDSPHRDDSIAFIEHIVQRKQLITMPSHGWFEVWCNVNRLSDVDRRYLHPVFANKMQLELELIHIDNAFLLKYGNVRLPHTKAGDHIFIVVCAVNKYPLVTWDKKMTEVGKEVGVQVYNPNEYRAAEVSA
ncbi:MAG: type II toxin-antitoxin system VapC family toxin [Candidatus Binatia bacterium]